MVREEQPALHEELEKLSLEIVEEGQLNELRVNTHSKTKSVKLRRSAQRFKR
jgi:hypothetical protein